MAVEAVEQVVHAQLHLPLLPLVAGAQVHQRVTGGGALVVHGRDFGLGAHGHQLGAVAPATLAVRDGQARVERHQGIQVLARVAVFAADVAQSPFQRPAAPARAVGQLRHARDVQPLQAHILVGHAQIDKALLGAGIGGGARAHRAHAAAAALCADVVVHLADVGRDRQAPLFAAGIVPMGGGAQGVGGFGAQVQVADVAVAIAHPVDHAHGHAAGGPGVALIQAGRTCFAGKAKLVIGVGIGAVARQGAEVPGLIAALAVGGIESVGLRVVIGVVALHLATVAADVAGAHAHLGEPLRIPARLPFGKHVQTVALAIADVPEHIRGHAAARGVPPVVQGVALRQGAHFQGVACRQGQLGAHVHAAGVAPGVHGHAGHVACRAVPELFVLTKIHAVACALVVHACLQLAPAALALVAQVELLAVVAGHVHALVGKVLVGNVLHAQAQIDHILRAAPGQAEAVVAREVAAGADLVATQPALGLVGRCRACGLEVAGRAVVVRLRHRAVVAQAELFGGVGGAGMAAFGVAVAAAPDAHFAFAQRARTGRGKGGWQRFDLDGGTNAVAAHAHRGDAGKQAHRAHARGVDVGQWRVHVVAARRDQVHAIELDAQPIVAQPLHAGQAGDAPGRVQAHPRQAAQQAGGVAAARALAGNGLGIQGAGGQGGGGRHGLGMDGRGGQGGGAIGG